MRTGFKGVVGVAVFVATVLTAAKASAITISDVGSVDTFLGSANLSNSGSGAEEAWIAGMLGVNVNTITYSQLAGSASGSWQAVTGGPANTNLYAFDFQAFGVADPDFFLIKTGNLQISNQTHFLYDNVSILRYGVIDLSHFGSNMIIQVGKISHVGTIGGTPLPPPTAAPEPASILLLGSGLGIFVASRIRRRVKRVKS